MQSLYITLSVAACAAIFMIIRKEQAYLQRVSNTFIKLMQKFESWQMLR